MKVVSHRIESYICITGFIFFADIALYTIIPELFDLSIEIKNAFWFGNFTALFLALGFMLSNLMIGTKAKYLMINLNVFIAIIGFVQQLIIFGVDLPNQLWCSFAPLYIVSTLIIFRYVRN